MASRLATIYGKTKARPDYRVAWTVAGRRKMEAHRTCSEAKRYADDLAKELAKRLTSHGLVCRLPQAGAMTSNAGLTRITCAVIVAADDTQLRLQGNRAAVQR